MKYTRFQDIPAFIEEGHWECDFEPDYLVKFIAEQEEDGLQLCPDFQRGRVWTDAQQTAFVEFFLRGGRTGRVIYLNKPSWHRGVKKGDYDDFVVVDGLQLLTAIRRFMGGEIKAFGSTIGEFTDRMRVNRRSMRVNINTLKTKAEVLQWYLQMNTGGTPHTSDEIERVRKLLELEGD
jgi:hypothetical protein